MRQTTRRVVSGVALILMALGPAPGVHAEDGDVGTITGRVTYAGPAPPAKKIHVHHDTHHCGSKAPILDESLRITDGGIANAVVIVTDAKAQAGQVPESRLLQQRNCSFTPHVISATVGATLAISNDDPVLHNVHARKEQRTFFNLAMPLPGVRVERKLDSPGLVSITCDSGHTWMSAYIMVVPHRLHGTTNTGGHFSIDGVPAGEHTLSVWHETLGVVTQKVTVPGGGGAHVALSYAKQKKELEPELLAALQSAISEKLSRVEETVQQELAAVKKHAIALSHQVAAAGRDIYLRHCATCHGARGDGNGPSRRFLTGIPRDFTRGEFKFKATDSGAPARPQDIYRTISVGVLGTEMPAWRDVLSPRQRMVLTRYLMSLSNRYDDLAAMPTPITIGEPPPMTSEAVARGAETFKLFGCGNCHGPSGAGDGLAAAELVDGWGNPIAPADLRRGYYKGGRGPKVVYRTIATGLAGTPMPAFGAALQGQAMWDLVFYVVSLGESGSVLDYLGAPAGRITPP